MLLQQEIRIGDQNGRGYARATACDFNIEPALFGYRLSFNFSFQPYTTRKVEPPVLVGWVADLYLRDANEPVLIGRLHPDASEEVRTIDDNGFTRRKYYDVRTDDMSRLAHRTHAGDVTFEFSATPVFAGEHQYPKTENGRLVIPHSEWLGYLNRAGVARYELIAIRVPVASSHLHKPFSEAVAKIREAERQYDRGDWNGAAASCRAAWRTVLSVTPQGTKPIEHILAPLVGDPRRKAFAEVLTKGLHDILNNAAHSEGDVKTGTPPSDLKAEEALLCIHWYTSIIAYLASLHAEATM